MTNKKTFLEFFQSSSGENSSKRLAFILSVLVASYVVISSSSAMIIEGRAEQAVKVLGYYLLFSAVLGGFVTAEILLKFIEKVIELKNGRGDDRDSN